MFRKEITMFQENTKQWWINEFNLILAGSDYEAIDNPNEKENNVEKNIKDMDTQEKIMMANAILNQTDASINKVKKVRKEKGLIEKTESSKIILTEDNRELLND